MGEQEEVVGSNPTLLAWPLSSQPISTSCVSRKSSHQHLHLIKKVAVHAAPLRKSSIKNV